MESPNSEQEHPRQANDFSQAQVSDETTRRSPIPSRTNHPTNNPPGQDTSLKQPQEIPTQKRQSLELPSDLEGSGTLSLGATDRVFPIRSVVSVDPTSTPTQQTPPNDGSLRTPAPASEARKQHRVFSNAEGSCSRGQLNQGTAMVEETGGEIKRPSSSRLSQQAFSEIRSSRSGNEQSSEESQSRPPSAGPGSPADDNAGIMTVRFKHIVTDGGHAIITGRDGDAIQRCEDEPIHIPGAVQGFGLLIALAEEDGKFIVRIVSENSKKIIGYSPNQLFALESFTDILSEEQADNFLDHVDFIRDEDASVATNGPEVFTLSIRSSQERSIKVWCAVHINDANPNLIICEFELEDDPYFPLVPPTESNPDFPEDTLNSNPTAEELAESTQNISRPLRVLRSARKQKGEAAAMEVFNIMSQVQEQLAAAPNIDMFLKVLVGIVKELTGFHRVLIYQFDRAFNGRVVTELVDTRVTIDLYKGLNFPASDIPKQARELYKINRVRLLYDRDQETARLVCRTLEDLKTPLDLTHSYLRAMSPIHLKYLANMAIRSSMSISINAFNELWGLISCHSYGSCGMRVSFPIRKMCRLVGESASRNIERLSYASRLQARKLIHTAPTQHNPSGYIVASSEDLLKLFNADFGLLCIRGETKILGYLENSQEALALLEYLRMRRIESVTTSQDITQDFPDLRYPPGFSVIAGMLLVPLSVGGNDFIVFFRKGQLHEVKWAGNPYEKFIKAGTEGYLEPRKSFRTWCETVSGKCREWTEEEIETAAVLCLVYGKFIEVWRQKEAAVYNTQLTRLLLANSAHEVRTPLNAIINYLEIALEGNVDNETRENLAKSHSASKSLIYVINDLLDLTKTEQGRELIKDELFDLKATLREATDSFAGDAKRKNIEYEVIEYLGVPQNVIGDQRRVRQAITNIAANAVQNTSQGGVKVEMYATSWEQGHVDVEVSVKDSGVGMNSKKVDSLFRDLEQVQSEYTDFSGHGKSTSEAKRISNKSEKEEEDQRTLGLGLAVVARIVRNMNGQLRLKSEEGKGSRFVVQFPFELPDVEANPSPIEQGSPVLQVSEQPTDGEVTLVEKDRDKRSSESSDIRISRKDSADSLNSRKSLKSLTRPGSGHSGRSDVDRLIEAIREPHLLDSTRRPSIERNHTSRARLETGQNYGDRHVSPMPNRARSLERFQELTVTSSLMVPTLQRWKSFENNSSLPVEDAINLSDTLVKTMKRPVEVDSPIQQPVLRKMLTESVPGEAKDKPENQIAEAPLTAEHMYVLVAEDDLVNSKIIKKRMEKLGHEIHLTSNGEECASAYRELAGKFDVVLMDMQMPIVDGLTSTKMIRSFEKTHPEHLLSSRAQLNGRIPIIAVSASLVEKERQKYIDAGFDGWILKPISFPRLNELMAGIVESKVREDALYKPGEWEKGGWFDMAQPNRTKMENVTDTKSDEKPTEKAEVDADSKVKMSENKDQNKEWV